MKGSSRQRQIIRLVAAGFSDKEIATQLQLSVATVKTHLGRVYRYNGFKNRAAAAAAYAVQESLVMSRVDTFSSAAPSSDMDLSSRALLHVALRPLMLAPPASDWDGGG